MKKIINIVIIFLILLMAIFLFLICNNKKNELTIDKKYEMYIASNNLKAPLYDMQYNKISHIIRGNKVIISKNIYKQNNDEYYKINLQNKDYYINKNNLVSDEKLIIMEKEKYVRTSTTLYESKDNINILSLIKKGTKLEIIGYDYIDENGIVNMYKVKNNNVEGYVYSKYLVDTLEESLENFDTDGNYQIHKKRGDSWGGGDASTLDYFPYEKAKFEDNIMPNEVRSLYVDVSKIKNIDPYIDLAKKSKINAFVVDIKDGTPGYPAEAMKKYSPTQYKKAYNTYEQYKSCIKKLKDAGFYVIGRITTFKDSYYAMDHPENTILNTVTNKPYNHDGSYWPSGYNRHVWEFNVALAIESVKEMGFNEIQFDYVRFPDRVGRLEKQNKINYNNKYNESKAQAIQNFVMYACDEIHKYGAYVSIDVFGESAHNYVTAYGQYWPAISNVADVISGMPYPDHFGKYEYGFKQPVWTIPYQLLNTWGKDFVMKRQSEIPTPAIVRTWIQAYNTIREPYIVYDESMISKQIQGLYDAGLTGGFITWNGGSSLNKYKQISGAFGKDYLNENN